MKVALLVAVHAHPVAIATETLPVVPAPETLVRLAGDNVASQSGAVGTLEALCVTVKVCPAIVSVPVRLAPVALAEMPYVTLPGPTPDVPPVGVIHEAWLVAFHGHPASIVTATVPLVASSSVALVGDSVAPQLEAADAACVTVNVCPATVIT